MDNKDMVVSTGNSPAELIRTAITTGGVDLDKLEKLLTLQERWEANEAKKAYHKAMTAFKLNPPSIEKDKKVAYGNTRYNHASLSNITDKINEGLSKHGLTASWKVENNGVVSVTCKITHEQGYSEETTLTAPPDTNKGMNSIQAIGSAISYLQRYSLLSLTGLAAHDVDDDGRGGEIVDELITEDEKKSILEELTTNKFEIPAFLKFMKLEKIEDMKKSQMNKAKSAIEAKKKSK